MHRIHAALPHLFKDRGGKIGVLQVINQGGFHITSMRPELHFLNTENDLLGKMQRRS